jgi:hypothetical protein
VADGSCDVSCNITECSFDGGDCDLSTEDDIGLYDENRHLENYDDDFNSYNENQNNYAHEFVNDNLFHNINFGGDLPDPRKRMNSLLDILIKENDKEEDFKGTVTYLREADKMKYMNPNDRNASDLHNTTPVMYRHGITNKFPVYGVNKLDSEKTTAQQMEINKPQPYDELHGGERNDTLYLEIISQAQQIGVDNTNIGNTSVGPGSNFVFQQKHSKLKYKNMHIKTKLVGDNGTSNYHISQSYVHGEFYPGLTSQDSSYIKTKELKRNGTDKFALLQNGQNVSGIPFYITEKFGGKSNESQNINITMKSDQTNGTEKTVISQNVKQKRARNSFAYSANLHNLYMKLNGKSDEPKRLYDKHNPAVADQDHISPKPQHMNHMDWKNEDKISKVSKKKQKILRIYDASQYGSLLSPGRKPRDTFAESLLYVNRLYNQEFGFEPRKVPAHMPHLINIDIMEHLQARYLIYYYLNHLQIEVL